MANTREWTDASKSIGYNFSYIKKPTTEVYSAIKSLGLDTVVWESYYGDEVRDVSRIRSFINKYKPCLFIYDPISLDSGLKKDFIFGVRNPEEVEKWIHLHYSQLKHYSFLMTTQIFNTGNGFVGTAVSDARGRLFVETLHAPGVSNQRKLSQMSENVAGYIDGVTIDSHEVSVKRGFLRSSDIRRIFDTYMGQKGYFEFVYGVQLGKLGIYTTGYETRGLFSFPEEVHMIDFTNPENRLRGRIIMNQKQL